ncbi:MAG TPA: AMP-binding protein [Parafilimonas sp.]|nr:AMP-binding protein [Parafilimonas sp.]
MKTRSYAHGRGAIPLLGETITQNLLRTCQKFSQREALVSVHQNYSATYAQLWEQVEIVAKAFLAIGVQKGDRAALWAPNCFERVLVQCATARIGAILVNVNPAYRTSEPAYVLGQSGTSVIVSAVSFKGSSYKDMINEAKWPCERLREIIYLRKTGKVF